MMTIFEKIISREIPADIIYEDDVAIAFLDVRPIQKGHVLVVPKHPYTDIFTIDTEVWAHVMHVVQSIARVQKERMGADGVNIRMNNGAIAGQEVMHAHVHVIPKKEHSKNTSSASSVTYIHGESAQLARTLMFTDLM